MKTKKKFHELYYFYHSPPQYNFVSETIRLRQVRIIITMIAEQSWFLLKVCKGKIIAATRAQVKDTTSQVDVIWKNSMLTELMPHRNLLFYKMAW